MFHPLLFLFCCFFFFSSRRRSTRCSRDWSSDVCSYDLPVARVDKGCWVDMAPNAALARAGPALVYAGTREGVYAGDGDVLNVCDVSPAVTALVVLAPGSYAAGRPNGLGMCRFDQGFTLVGVTYRERPDSDTQGIRHTWFERPIAPGDQPYIDRSEEHTSELQSRLHLVCRLLLEKKKKKKKPMIR